MNYTNLPWNNPEIKKIVQACYPGHRGRKVRLTTSIPASLDSYWSGGSKDYYVFYDLSTGKSFSVHSNHPFFEPHQPRQLDKLPAGIIIVRHTIFCGKSVGIVIHANPQDINPLITQ